MNAIRDLLLRVGINTQDLTKGVADIDRHMAQARAATEKASAAVQSMGKQGQAAMVELERATRSASEGLTRKNEMLSTLTRTLGAYLGPAAIAGAILKTLQYAEALERASVAMGTSAQATQRLENIAIGANTTLTAITSAITMMQDRLAGGDASAVAALQKLGLTVQQVFEASPDQQFLMIARALNAVRSAEQQLQLGKDIFGRPAVEVIGAFRGKVDELAASVGVLSNKQVEGLSAAEGVWDRLLLRAQRYGALLLAAPMHGTMASWAGPQLPDLPRASEMKPFGALKSPSVSPFSAAGAQAQMDKAQQATEKATAAAIKLAAERERGEHAWAAAVLASTRQVMAARHVEGEALFALLAREHDARMDVQSAIDAGQLAIRGLQVAYQNLGGELQRTLALQAALHGAAIDWNPVSQRVSESVDEVDRFQRALQSSADGLRALATTGDETFQKIMRNAANAVDALDQAFNGERLKLRSAEGMVHAAQGAANVWSAAGDRSLYESSAARIGRTTMAGAQAGAAYGPIGAGVGAIGGLITGWLRGRSQGEKTNDTRDQFLAQFGGFEGLSKQAGMTDEVMKKLLNAKTVKDFEAAVKGVETALGAAKAKAAELEAVLQKYGVIWTDFEGPEQMKRLGDAIKGVEKDYQLLTQAGLSHEAALKKVKDGYLQIAMQAVEAGQQIPAALAPALLDLARMGALTEEQAAKLLGLAGAGGPSFDEVAAAAQRYGIELDKLGPKVAQLSVNDAGKKLAEDFELFMKAGADTSEVIKGMSKDVNEVIHRALRMGTQVPAGMRDMLQKFVDQGELTDENGNKLKDLSGINFAEPIEEAIGRLIEKLEELIEKIGKAKDEFKDLPSGVPGGGGDGGGGDGGSSDGPDGPIPQAYGGFGRVTRPTLFLAGEAGPEDYAFSGANRRFGSGGGSGSVERAIDRLGDRLERRIRSEREITVIQARDAALKAMA